MAAFVCLVTSIVIATSSTTQVDAVTRASDVGFALGLLCGAICGAIDILFTARLMRLTHKPENTDSEPSNLAHHF